MVLKSQDTVGMVFGVSTKLWLGATIFIFTFFILSNLQNISHFNTAIAFMLIYLISISWLIMIQAHNGSHLSTIKEFDAFWMEDITRSKLGYIGIGLVGVFASVGIALVFQSAFVGILISGIIMMWAFLRTNSILIPIIIHGIYNTFVMAMQNGTFGSLTGFATVSSNVPQIGIGLGGFTNFYTEAVWQFMLVATAEEVLKIGILAFIVLMLKGRLQTFGKPVYVAGFIAVIIWALAHTIQAIPI